MPSADGRTPAARLGPRLERVWGRRGLPAWLLCPLGLLYCAVATLRRRAYLAGLLRRHRFPVPVIVVGNITVGGAGKTPLTIELAGFLGRAGYRPGIVTRGYRGRARVWPQRVTADSAPALVGDEPVVLAERTRCPVIADPDRVRAVRTLLADCDCDVVISDDGLQHYRLARAIEIAVVDGQRRFGNGFCLPAGPLRERPKRLEEVDLLVCQGASPGKHEFGMHLVPDAVRRVSGTGPEATLDDFRADRVHAVAGIGHPRRFFDDLRRAGLAIHEHPFPDHHEFDSRDLQFGDRSPVLMTEKDAVKCRSFADERMWFVPIRARADDAFYARLTELMRRPS